MILILVAGLVAQAFSLSPEATAIVKAFAWVGAGGFVFLGCVYVSNAAFNNLGKPTYSMIVNWLRDGVFTYPCCIIGAYYFAAEGVIYGGVVAGGLVGVLSVLWGQAYITRVEQNALSVAPA
jgi:Na+-driven multidrug efflux pump